MPKILPFLAKIRQNSKWPPFLGRGKKCFYLLNRARYNADTLGSKILDEITLSGTVKEIEANLCFAIFGKNSKIQNGRHFWGGENFCQKLQNTNLLLSP